MDPKNQPQIIQYAVNQPMNGLPPNMRPVFSENLYGVYHPYPSVGMFPISYAANLPPSQPMLFPGGARHQIPFMMSAQGPIPLQENMFVQPPEQKQEQPKEINAAENRPSEPQVSLNEEAKEEGGSSKKEKHKEEAKDKDKNENETRLYKCSKCDKTYLSYPALYTHTKLKHLHPGESPSITNGRMRGRPRKNIVYSTTHSLTFRQLMELINQILQLLYFSGQRTRKVDLVP